MAIALAIGNIVKTTVWCTETDQASANSFFYQVTAVGGTPATDLDLATQFDAAVSGGFANILANPARYNGVQSQIVFPLPVRVAQLIVTSATIGNAGAIVLPRQTTGLTTWRTTIAGRKGRGRTYWPFPSVSSDTGDGKPVAGYVTNISTLSTAIINFTNVALAGRTATVSLVVYHRALHTSDPILNYTARGTWATQRRRGGYGRPNVSPI